MKRSLTIILILITNLSYASFPIYTSSSNKIIVYQNEIFEQYQDGLMNQASYTTQSFNKADRFKKKKIFVKLETMAKGIVNYFWINSCFNYTSYHWTPDCFTLWWS